jgi:hypothetical protein
MAMKDRFYAYTDRPMTWTRAILLGFLIWIFAVLLLGQLPSWIIYFSDTYVSQIIEITKDIPGVSEEGLNPKQIAIVRDIVANTVQMGALVFALVVVYFWQERKRKRTGQKGVQDTVKGYMSGK